MPTGLGIILTDCVSVLCDIVASMNSANKKDLLWSILKRLYKIRNVANLAVFCPEKDVEAYILQDVLELISELTQTAIEEMEALN